MVEKTECIKDRLVKFLTNNPQSLKAIYENHPDVFPHVIRGKLNSYINRYFKRIGRGVYLSINGESKALLITGDSWEVIKEFDNNSIDAIITDSAYTCLNHHLTMGTTRKKSGKWSFQTKDIDNELMKEMWRILKPGGHFFSFLPANAKDTVDYNMNFVNMARTCGFQFNKQFIWDKEVIGMGYNGRNRHESIYFFSKGKRHMPYDLSIPDVIKAKRIHSKSRIHESEKPIKLIETLLKFCCRPGDVALDLFGGSMSLTKAGFNLGIHTICVEIDENIMQKSIEAI